MLTRAPFLETSIKEFFDFLEGKKTTPYDDTGEKLLNSLYAFFYKCLHERAKEFLSEQRGNSQDGKESQSIGEIDVIDFLIKVFPEPCDILGPSLFRETLSGLNPNTIMLIYGWLTHYREAELDTLKNPSSKGPLFGIFSQSPVHKLILSLLEEACTFPNSIDDDDVAQKCDKIKDAIMNDLMDYLTRLSIGEANAQPQPQRALKHSPPERNIVAGGPNQQDGTSQDIEYMEWVLAWEEEFRGSALDNLEMKLSLNVQALQTGDIDKLGMSRIIPINRMQPTGCLANIRYVKENFGVLLRLENGYGYPPYDDYVYKYFKNLLKLKERNWDTPDNPEDLSGLNNDDLEEYLQRYSDGGYLVDETRSVYTDEWRYQMASGLSVPKGWAAVGRLRVTCFLIGFFNTMVSYMETKNYTTVQNWRENLLHTNASAASTRSQFWYDVIKESLKILKQYDFQRTWWEGNKNRSNAKIKTFLMEILTPSITAFFKHPLTIKCLSEMRKPDLPFLLIIDEAAYLYQTNYMHSFMWVLDEPVVDILRKLGLHYPQAKQFFVLMLSTHPQISRFTPDYIYPSEQYFIGKQSFPIGKQSFPSIFLSLDWDGGVDLPERSIQFNQSTCIQSLVKWGRPMWLSFYNGLDRAKILETTAHNNAYILMQIILYAVEKLREPDRNLGSLLNRVISEESSLTIFAILAIRLHLDLDFAAPSRASQLVTSRLRWLIDVDSHRKYLITTYGSEPVVVEAAAYLLNSPRKGDTPISVHEHPWISSLNELRRQLSQGYVNKGAHGELTARLLLIIAKDQVTRQSWWEDDAFLSRVTELERTKINRDSFAHMKSTSPPKYYFKEAVLYYRNPPDGFAFFHHFLKGFLSEMVFSKLASHFKGTKKWKSLDNAYVNFTHWAPVMGDDSDSAFTKEGFFANWIRHKAYFLGKSNFKAIDLVIPMAFPIKKGQQEIIDLDSMSHMVISVKNKISGSELKRQTYLSTSKVEGVSDGDGRMKPGSKSSDLKLTLHSLTFINPSTNIISDEKLVNHWVEASVDKPYIAFTMSMGDTLLSDTSQLFIAEKSTQRSQHRIVFGLQGFMNTYRFPDPLIQEILEDILMHHDVSGRYPASAPDYREEEVVLRAARKPLDEPEDILRRWFPSTPIDLSDVDMTDDQEDEEEVEEDDEKSNNLDDQVMIVDQ